VKVQSGADAIARRSARDLQQQKYGTMSCTVFWKFNHSFFPYKLHPQRQGLLWAGRREA
jgi:hypothetical protein